MCRNSEFHLLLRLMPDQALMIVVGRETQSCDTASNLSLVNYLWYAQWTAVHDVQGPADTAGTVFGIM